MIFMINTDIKDLVISNLNVKYFSDFANERILNGYIQKVQMINSEEKYLKIKINAREKNETLIIGNGFFILTKYNPSAKENNKGFSSILNKLLYNKRILEIKQINLEKIVEFIFYDYILIIELFSHNNIILTDKDHNIIDCLYKEEWKNRVIKPKHKYILPESNMKNILEIKNEDIIFDAEKNLISNVLNNVNTSPAIIQIVLNKCNIKKENSTEKNLHSIITALKEFYKRDSCFDFVYVSKENKKEFITLQLEKTDLPKLDNSLNDLLDETIVKNLVIEKQIDIKDKKDKKIQSLQNILKTQEKKFKDLEKLIVENNIKGDLIYQNFKDIEDIMDVIKSARKKEVSFKEIESVLKNNVNKNEILKIFKKIDEKNKKVIFILPQQQVVSHQL